MSPKMRQLLDKRLRALHEFLLANESLGLGEDRLREGAWRSRIVGGERVHSLEASGDRLPRAS